MKISKLVLGGVLLLSSAGVVHPAWSQGAPIVPVKVTPHILPLRYVPASLMAFWLDPRNHPEPTNEQVARTQPPGTEIKRMGTSLAKAPASGLFTLPKGIERIDVKGPHALSVVGTDEAIEELKSTIAFLDKRLRQVEIEAQFVVMSPEDAKAFGIDAQGFETKSPNNSMKGGTVLLGFVRENLSATLNVLENQGRAKVLSAPRVTAINDLTATLSQIISRPGVIGTQDKQGHFQPLFNTDQGAQPSKVSFDIGEALNLTLTPTINNDDTVTLMWAFKTTLQLQRPSVEPVTLQTSDDFQSIMNARDGQTMAVSGLDSRFLEDAQTSPDKIGGKQLFLFITPRILRRVGEKNKA